MPLLLPLQVLPSVKQANGSRQALLQAQGQWFLLEAREDGHLYVGEAPQTWTASDDNLTSIDQAQRDMHDAGFVGKQGASVLGLRTTDEDIIVWTETEVKVCRSHSLVVVRVRASLIFPFCCRSFDFRTRRLEL